MTTPERLKEILNEHFYYEVVELANSKEFFIWMNKQPLGTSRQAFLNMALEHTLLHARNLFEFYFKLKTKYNQDAYPKANMYVLTFQIPPFTQNIESDFYERVCNQITHLGIDRTNQNSKKFNIVESMKIATDLLIITKVFLSDLEAVNNGFYFDTNLNQLKKDINEFIKI